MDRNREVSKKPTGMNGDEPVEDWPVRGKASSLHSRNGAGNLRRKGTSSVPSEY